MNMSTSINAFLRSTSFSSLFRSSTSAISILVASIWCSSLSMAVSNVLSFMRPFLRTGETQQRGDWLVPRENNCQQHHLHQAHQLSPIDCERDWSPVSLGRPFISTMKY